MRQGTEPFHHEPKDGHRLTDTEVQESLFFSTADRDATTWRPESSREASSIMSSLTGLLRFA